MSKELQHKDIGTELTQAEWEGEGTHIFDSQAIGDLPYASATDQISGLGIGSTGDYLRVAGGVPDWQATTSITSLGTIATGVWQGTDVGVAYGGTGVSTLTDGGVLLGSGTGAITAMAVLTDGQMIVGDGTTDPVAESGATLRTSIGVGTGDTVEFAGITGTTIDASTDFTIGDTVITNGVITDSSGLSLAAAVDLGANTLTSTGSMQIRTIDYSDGDLAITIADGGGITAAAGITSTAASNSFGATSFNDADITNVDSIAINSIVADSGISIGIGTDPSANQLLRVGGTHTNPTANGVALGLFPAITTATGSSNYSIARFNASVTTYAASDTYTNISTLMLDEPSITLGSGSSATVAATLTINDAPTEATNNYAFFVDSGAIRLDGAISLGTDHGSDGEQLTSGGDDAACDWTAASSLREHKHIGKKANPDDALKAMLDSKAYHFHYKDRLGTGDSDTEYVGVMADDAPWAMHYKGKIVNPVNSLGYTVLSIQALHDKITKLETAIVTMRDE